MRNVILTSAALGLGLSAASACDFQRSAGDEQSKIDTTVVASVAVAQSTPVEGAAAPDIKSQDADRLPVETRGD